MNTNISTNRLGIISFKSTSHCGVMFEGQEILCQIAKNIKLAGEKKPQKKATNFTARELENLIVVGDHVNVIFDSGGGGMITERFPRINQISRRSSSTRVGGQLIEQVLVSNVDQVIAVIAAANPEPKWNLLDRYLVMAEAAGLPVSILITKIDLVEKDERFNELTQRLAVYQSIGYQVVMTSSVQQLGLNSLYDLLRNQSSIMIGKSGVGKTSLLNALIPGRNDKVNSVNEVTGKGRHTTTSMRLIPLDPKTMLIDSPGTREFGLWDVDPDDLDWYFPEMRPYLNLCKFKLDCRHEDEPGCAVRKAVVNQQIDPQRYQSYLRLKEDFLS